MLFRLTGLVMAVARSAMVSTFVVMMAMTLFQVVNRYWLGLSVFWTEELIVFLLVWATMLGMPVQLWEHQEIVVDFLSFADPPAERAKLWLAAAASVAFCVVLAWSGWNFASRSWAVTSPVMGLSRFWFFVPIPLCAALSILALLVRRKVPSTGGFE